MSDTPRTDEQINGKPCTRFECLVGDSLRDALLPSQFARQLERELNAANQRIKRLEEAGDALKKSRSCGCQNGDSIFYCITCISAWDAWLKAKEDKP